MFSVGVRDHVMIAHSFSGELFGPAQRLHGATYVVDVEFRAARLHESGVIVDIGRAADALKRGARRRSPTATSTSCPSSRASNTTTEFMAKLIFDRMVGAHRARASSAPAATALASLKVTLHESHVAWASVRARALVP